MINFIVSIYYDRFWRLAPLLDRNSYCEFFNLGYYKSSFVF